MKTKKLLNDLTLDAVDLFINELKKDENRILIENHLIDPLMDHISKKIQPFIILMVGLYLIIIVMISFVLYLCLA